MASEKMTREQKREQEIREYDHNYYARIGRSRPLTIEEEDRLEKEVEAERKEIGEFFEYLFFCVCVVALIIIIGLVLYDIFGHHPPIILK